MQEAIPLKNIWCVKLMVDAQAPEIISGQLNVVKTCLKARYRLPDLLRAQQNDRMTINLKRWIENGAPDTGDLEKETYKILKQFYLKRKGLLYFESIIRKCYRSFIRLNYSFVYMIRWAINAWKSL